MPTPVGAGSNKWMFGVVVEGCSGWWSQGGMPRFVVIQALLAASTVTMEGRSVRRHPPLPLQSFVSSKSGRSKRAHP